MRLDLYRMIDRVDRIDLPARSIRCRTEVPRESSVFDAHFPGRPLLPGTLMIETIAQCCGLLVLAVQDFATMPVLISVDRARMRGAVMPGTVIEAEGRLVQEGALYAAVAGRLLSAGREVADAEIRLGSLPFPSEQLRDEARAYARGIGLI
jgi:3-hydroxyacyl-[acyl-carrier-protein] dehydratase